MLSYAYKSYASTFLIDPVCMWIALVQVGSVWFVWLGWVLIRISIKQSIDSRVAKVLWIFYNICTEHTLSLSLSLSLPLAHSLAFALRFWNWKFNPMLFVYITLTCLHCALLEPAFSMSSHSIWFGCCWSRWFQLQMTAGYFMFINKYWILLHCFLCTNFSLSGVVFFLWQRWDFPK